MHTQEITISLAKALDTVLQVTTASSLRAGDINIIRDQGYTYSCVGSQVIHTHGGIISIHQALKIVKHMHRHCILLYFWQIEHLFDMHIETSQVWHIQAAVELVDANTVTIPPIKEDGPTTSNIKLLWSLCMWHKCVPPSPQRQRFHVQCCVSPHENPLSSQGSSSCPLYVSPAWDCNTLAPR